MQKKFAIFTAIDLNTTHGRQNVIGISVIITTRDSASSLRALLASLDQLNAPPVRYEIIVADNGSVDETPRLLGEWKNQSPQQRTVLTILEPGKCRAANRAIAVARGELLVFFDHDVVVDREHLGRMLQFFQSHDCWAAQGRILLPTTTDYPTRELLFFGGIPQVDPAHGARLSDLVGANIAVRREVFGKVGFFHEGLGPGAAGCREDTEFARRILAHGGWIAGVPDAHVTHEINPKRLTPEYYQHYRLMEGRSSYVLKPRARWTWILPKLLLAGLRCAVVTAWGNRRRRYRVLGRWYFYRGMLEASEKSSHQRGIMLGAR